MLADIFKISQTDRFRVFHTTLGTPPKKQARKLQATLVRNYDRLTDGGEV